MWIKLKKKTNCLLQVVSGQWISFYSQDELGKSFYLIYWKNSTKQRMNCQVYYEFHYNSFKGHEFHYTFITHFIPKSFFGHAKTTHFIPNTKKKKKKAISLHIQRAWITYPFHYNSFEEHEVHYPLRTQYNDE